MSNELNDKDVWDGHQVCAYEEGFTLNGEPMVPNKKYPIKAGDKLVSPAEWLEAVKFFDSKGEAI